MVKNLYEAIDTEARRQYVKDHAPGILRALIIRRSSTDPVQLIDPAIETAMALYDKIDPPRKNGFRRIDQPAETLTEIDQPMAH